MIGALFRTISRLLTFILLVVVLTAVYVVYDGLADSGRSTDCAVVLGAAVKADGQPSAVLRERLDTAIRLYKESKVPVIVVSGADPAKGDGHSEAAAMAKYLREHEVAPKAIIEDHSGVNTDATARNLKGIMKTRELKSVTIVTSYYHVTRTKMALKNEGIGDFAQAHAGSVRKEDFFSVMREVLDIYYHLFRNNLGPAAQKAGEQLQAEAVRLNTQLHSETQHVEEVGKKAAQ